LPKFHGAALAHHNASYSARQTLANAFTEAVYAANR